MKSLLFGLLVISSVQISNAASTDTIKQARTKIVELRITREVIKAADTRRSKSRIENLEGQGVCSGALVSASGDILTARHCTDGAVFIDVLYGDRQYRSLVTGVSKIHDLALLHIDAFNTPHFELAKSLEQGEVVYVLGSPLSITGAVSTGVVAKLNGDINYIDCGVLPGNSGGPVFNEKGKLVGIATAGFVVLYGTTHLNIMQSLEAILGFGLFRT